MRLRTKFDINTFLMVIGFGILLIGFFISPKSTVGFHFDDTDLVFSKPLLLRIIGLMSVLNGLFFKYIEAGAYPVNIRWKNLSIVLFFLSIVIIGLSNLLELGMEGGKDLDDPSFSFVFVESMMLAGMATLMISLLMPVVIWLFAVLKNRKNGG